jgi:DnaJ-class molecular chaperone
MTKSGSRPVERERKVKRVDDEIVEHICPLCNGRGEREVAGPHYEDRETCSRCEGLGVIYAEE